VDPRAVGRRVERGPRHDALDEHLDRGSPDERRRQDHRRDAQPPPPQRRRGHADDERRHRHRRRVQPRVGGEVEGPVLAPDRRQRAQQARLRAVPRLEPGHQVIDGEAVDAVEDAGRDEDGERAERGGRKDDREAAQGADVSRLV